MSNITSVQNLNEVMESYLEKLAKEDPVFLDHVSLFKDFGYSFINECNKSLFQNTEEVGEPKKSLEGVRKESLLVTLRLVMKYFSETYGKSYVSLIEKALIKEIASFNLKGTIMDGCILVHELSQLLNVPTTSESERKFLSNLSTKGISFFESFNYIDYLSGIYPETELNILRKTIIHNAYDIAIDFNWETLLVEIYGNYGNVSPENFNDYCGEDPDALERMVINRGFSEELSNNNKYIFGINLALYLHYKMRENPKFISTIMALNEELRNNPVVTNGQDIPAFFNRIGLNLELDEPFAEYVASELEYINSRDEVPGVKL